MAMVTAIRNQILRIADPFIRIPVLGLDISDLSIKYLKFGGGRMLTLDDFGEVTVAEGIISNGEIRDEEALVTTLNSWLLKDGRRFRGSFVAVSLPEEKSFLRLIQLPKIKREELGNAIRWEIEANIPMPADELSYDYEVIEPLEGGADHFDVVLTAFPKAIVESYVRVLKKSGLEPLALELESQAIIRAAIADLKERTAKLVVDMGRTRTSFIIISGGAIIFTTTIELGGRLLEEHIVRGLGVDWGKAVVLKKEVGFNKKELEGRVFTALVPPVAAFGDELRRSIEYYHNHTKHIHGASESIEEILLVGGDANLNGLDTYLSSMLKVPVRLANPFASIRHRLAYAIPPIAKNKALAFTTALGLAMRGLE